MGTTVGGDLGGSVGVAESEATGGRGQQGQSGNKSQGPIKSQSTSGRVGASIGFRSQDQGIESETAQANLDIVNYDVRNAIAAAQRAAARSSDPSVTFSRELSNRILGPEGLRNRYLGDADAGRATFDATGPITSIDQNAILKSGRFSLDAENSPADGDSTFKKR